MKSQFDFRYTLVVLNNKKFLILIVVISLIFPILLVTRSYNLKNSEISLFDLFSLERSPTDRTTFIFEIADSNDYYDFDLNYKPSRDELENFFPSLFSSDFQSIKVIFSDKKLPISLDIVHNRQLLTLSSFSYTFTKTGLDVYVSLDKDALQTIGMKKTDIEELLEIQFYKAILTAQDNKLAEPGQQFNELSDKLTQFDTESANIYTIVRRDHPMSLFKIDER